MLIHFFPVSYVEICVDFNEQTHIQPHMALFAKSCKNACMLKLNKIRVFQRDSNELYNTSCDFFHKLREKKISLYFPLGNLSLHVFLTWYLVHETNTFTGLMSNMIKFAKMAMRVTLCSKFDNNNAINKSK